MLRNAAVLLVLALAVRAEVRQMRLKQVVDAALAQNPDIALARLDEEKARQATRIARDPFMPRIVVGSGLAKSYGFPMSVEGSAPTVVRVDATQYLFNKQQSLAVAQAKEEARGAGFATVSKRDEVAYRATTLYLEAERAARIGELARKDAESLAQVLEAVKAQVAEGRALPLAEKQAEYNLAHSRALAEGLDADCDAAESDLAVALGLSAADRVRPIREDRPQPAIPESKEQALAAAIAANPELKRLQSVVLAKQIQVHGQEAGRLPRADLIAQYGMFAKFNNYEQYFSRFQRNNAQIGVSLQLPVFTGSGIAAQVAQTTTEISRARIEYTNTRNKIQSDLEAAFREVKRASTNAELTRLDLDLAREQLSVTLAQMQEGRAPMRQVEEARIAENSKWIAFYDAQYTLEKSKWNVLRVTGELASAAR
jgi:outer membrane protein